jgi:hypothetical protein
MSDLSAVLCRPAGRCLRGRFVPSFRNVNRRGGGGVIWCSGGRSSGAGSSGRRAGARGPDRGYDRPATPPPGRERVASAGRDVSDRRDVAAVGLGECERGAVRRPRGVVVGGAASGLVNHAFAHGDRQRRGRERVQAMFSFALPPGSRGCPVRAVGWALATRGVPDSVNQGMKWVGSLSPPPSTWTANCSIPIPRGEERGLIVDPWLRRVVADDTVDAPGP